MSYTVLHGCRIDTVAEITLELRHVSLQEQEFCNAPNIAGFRLFRNRQLNVLEFCVFCREYMRYVLHGFADSEQSFQLQEHTCCVITRYLPVHH